jgi:hypothetical protein
MKEIVGVLDSLQKMPVGKHIQSRDALLSCDIKTSLSSSNYQQNLIKNSAPHQLARHRSRVHWSMSQATSLQDAQAHNCRETKQ